MIVVIERADLKQTAAKSFRALQLMLAGAFLLAISLDLTSHAIEGLSWSLLIAYWIAAYIAGSLAPQTGPSTKQPSPRASGVGVIAVTGAAATFAMARGGMIGDANPIGAVVIALGTLIACAAMWRFATKHGGDIGEARFPTT